MNRILVIIFSTIATSLAFSKRRKQRFAQKDSILKKIKNRHAAQRIEMNLALKEFNIKFASWMLYKSMTEKTPKALLYGIYYNELLSYRKKWIDNFEEQCRYELSSY